MEWPENLKKNIKKCSKCGLCQSVCPIYKITGNECAVSKGKFVMLEGVIKSELKLNKTIDKYLNMCSLCAKCKDFCPSKINPPAIFNNFKYIYAKNSFLHKILFKIQDEKIFNTLLNFTHFFTSKFYHTKSIKNSGKLKLLYFRGCADKINPKNEISLKNLLSKHKNIELIEKDFDCCGVPFLSSGNLERFDRAKARNLEIINSTSHDFVITNCASCEDNLKAYSEKINVISVSKFLTDFKYKFESENKLRVTFHKPCHFHDYENVKKLLLNIKNIEYVEMDDFDECCGFCGEFSLKNWKISKALMKMKAQNAINSKADVILTLCPACETGIKIGGFLLGKNLKIMNITDFLNGLKLI